MLPLSRSATTTVVVLGLLLGPAAAHATSTDELTSGETSEGEEQGDTGDDDTGENVDAGDDDTEIIYSLDYVNLCEGGDRGPEPDFEFAEVGVDESEMTAYRVIWVPEYLDGTETVIRDVPLRVTYIDTVLTVVVPRGEGCSGQLTPPEPLPEPEPTTSSTVIEAPSTPEPQPTETGVAAPTREPAPEETAPASADALAPGFRQALENGTTATPPQEPVERPTPEPTEEDDTEVLGVVLEREPAGVDDPSTTPIGGGVLAAAALTAAGVLVWRRREDLFGG